MVHVSEALLPQFRDYTVTAMIRFTVFAAGKPTFFKNVWNCPMSSTSTLIKSVEYYFFKDYFNMQEWRQMKKGEKQNQNLLEEVQPVWAQASGKHSQTHQVWVKFSLKSSIVQSDFQNLKYTWQASQAKDFSACCNNRS